MGKSIPNPSRAPTGPRSSLYILQPTLQRLWLVRKEYYKSLSSNTREIIKKHSFNPFSDPVTRPIGRFSPGQKCVRIIPSGHINLLLGYANNSILELTGAQKILLFSPRQFFSLNFHRVMPIFLYFHRNDEFGIFHRVEKFCSPGFTPGRVWSDHWLLQPVCS